jgi:2-keto-4-pentenoate hydratase
MSTEPTTLAETTFEPGRVAERLVHARRSATALLRFPGAFPQDLAGAYACQEAGIKRWPDRIAGWKVGWVPAADQPRIGEERLVGPIFSQHLEMFTHQSGTIDAPVFEGGFGAIEAEYAFRLGRDAPADKLEWTLHEAAALVDTAHVAVEIASSPFAGVNQHGAFVTIADFGNNAGLLVGPTLANWSIQTDDSGTCRTEVEGQTVGVGGAASLPGGPLAGLAFALGRCARNGRPLRAGQYVTTGAATGIHDVLPGQLACITFDGVAVVQLRATARPRA